MPLPSAFPQATTSRATFVYPRIRYGTTPITIDIPDGAIAHAPQRTGLRGENVVASGKREYLEGRVEESVTLDLLCGPDALDMLERFFSDHAWKGEQFQLWVDRFTGSCWLFNDSLKDQNGLTLTLSSGSATYGDAAGGRGIVLSGGQYLSVALAQASAATPTGFDDPLAITEGLLVLDLAPDFAGNDGTLHYLLDTTGTSTNRLSIYKTAANALTLEIRDGAGGSKTKSGAVSWAADARVQILASWATDGTLRLWVAIAGGAFTELTTAGGAGTGILGALPTTLSIGAENDGTDAAPGTYDTVFFLKRAFPDPHRTFDQHGAKPLHRNYFPTAELVTPIYQPQRWSPTAGIWRWPLSVRLGVA